jgi:nucleoside-diphosphate-sugar epimerase
MAAVRQSLDGATDVIHLACISNDPSFDLDPKLGKSINLDSFKPLVNAAKESSVNRFIYASSSSVYGIKSEENVTEDLRLEPLTDYSKFKMICEEILLENTTNDFQCTVLRPATVCGVSPRQRFDLSVNILTNHAINKNKITVLGGSQYRPNLHIQDMARAYLHLLEQGVAISGEVFNVGSENISIADIAERVRLTINPDLEIDYLPTNDLRSYRVDSSKIKEKIGFNLTSSVDEAIKDLGLAFAKGKYVNSLENPLYFNIKRMKELLLA